jgi:tetratricopeptide (TPR) repeat protein
MAFDRAKCLRSQPNPQPLITRTMEAHKESRFADEVALWEEVCKERPERLDFLHNVALAKMNAGQWDEALSIFDDLIVRAPKLSRVHNNRASLLVRMGVDVQFLLLDFMTAIYLSEGPEDFTRHVFNAYQAAAHGPDIGGEELLDAIEQPIVSLIEQRFALDQVAKETKFFRELLGAYRYMARYRRALGRKDWRAAEEAVAAAKSAFLSVGLSNFAAGSDAFAERLSLYKRVFGLLEDIASDAALSPSVAEARANALITEASRIRSEEPGSVQQRLVDVFGWFLNLLLRELRFLSGASDVYSPVDEEVQIMLWLSSSSFRSVGDDLMTVINFGNRRCLELQEQLGMTASAARADMLRRDQWVRIALCVHGRVFDFRGVDTALAHAVLGRRDDALTRVRSDLLDFRTFVERQAYADIFVDSSPRENIARALIQAHLSARTYREVPVRGGRSDVLMFMSNRQRILIEAKIWKGPEYHEQGIREIEEYILGENDDKGLLGTFYLVFDPTEGARAAAHEGAAVSSRMVGGAAVDVIVIRLRPPTPSKTSGSSQDDTNVA